MKLSHFPDLNAPIPLNDLSSEQLEELQTVLNFLGYPAGEIDGLIGPKTRSAWGEFQADNGLGNIGIVDPNSLAVMQRSLDTAQKAGDYDFTSKDGTIRAIIGECQAQGIGSQGQIAYVLATVDWETRTFQPVREAYWNSERWRQAHLRYYPYYGRGYVQLTWRDNYQQYGRLLGIDLAGQPDLALKPEYALFILVHGFKTGTFTGRKISDYIKDGKADFINARRCINGVDHAADIAKLAKKYLWGARYGRPEPTF